VGSSCAIGVFFDPTASGARSGTLTITDDAMDSPQTVTLTGNGEDFSIAPASAATMTVAAGQTASYSLSVAPAGGFSQTVAFSCTGAPARSTCTVSPSTVALNGSAAASVSVSVVTTASSLLPGPSFPDGPPRSSEYLLAIWGSEVLGLVLLAGLAMRRKNRRPSLAYGLAVLVLVSAGIAMSACASGSSSNGGGGTQGTPAGTYTLAVSGTFTSGSATLSHVANLTVKVQ
ncbi:MAG: hypothetical protein ACRD4Y_00280, partial [Candidatus Acidiferrales bacterium]